MRRSSGLLAAMLLAFGVAAQANAATLTLTGSTLSVEIGLPGLPPLTVAQSPAALPIFVSSGGGSFLEPAGVFAATTFLPIQLFTGVALVSSLGLTASNGTKVVSAGGGGGGGFGGAGPLNGQAVIGVLGGLVNLVIPLGVAGGGGTAMTGFGSIMITATGHLWTTGPAVVTGITIPTGLGGFANTAMATGYDARTAGHKGTIQLVTPIRILTNAAGNLNAFAIQTLTFVPEPGTLMLFGGGAVGLGLVGRKRMRGQLRDRG